MSRMSGHAVGRRARFLHGNNKQLRTHPRPDSVPRWPVDKREKGVSRETKIDVDRGSCRGRDCCSVAAVAIGRRPSAERGGNREAAADFKLVDSASYIVG